MNTIANTKKNAATARWARLGARHGHRVVVVLQAVVGFVLNRRIGRLLVHAGLEAASLDHEARDHAVEDGVVVMALLHVGQEVGDRLRRLGFVEFQRDDAVASDVQFHLGVAHGKSFAWGYFTSVAELMTMGVFGTSEGRELCFLRRPMQCAPCHAVRVC
jgi:hypothetical protein